MLSSSGRRLMTVMCFSSSANATSFNMFFIIRLRLMCSLSTRLGASSIRVSTEMSRKRTVRRLLCA